MFDFSFSEIALFVMVAMVFIRPKDLPVAIRTLSNGLKAMRRMAAEFQSHVDEMVREADLSEARDQFRDLKTSTCATVSRRPSTATIPSAAVWNSTRL